MVWRFQVRPERAHEFERVYGAEGPWVRLFRRAEGYLGTELYREQGGNGEYLTVDRWISETAYGRFRSAAEADYRRIDRECENLTIREEEIGRFRIVLGSPSSTSSTESLHD